MADYNVFLLTHNDLDGAACAIVAALVLVYALEQEAMEADCDNLRLRIGHHDYSNIDKALERVLDSDDEDRADVVILADISPGAQWFEEEADPRVVILDHHKNNAFAKNSGHFRGVFDEHKCGASLLLEWLLERTSAEYRRNNSALLFRLVHFVGTVWAWDTWQLRSPLRPEAEEMQLLFSFLGMERFTELALEHIRHDHLSPQIPIAGIPRILQEREDRYVRSRIDTAEVLRDADGNTFAWAVANRRASQIGHELAPGVDYAAIYMPEYGKVELRSDGGFNVGALAKTRGGGGHDSAAGYPAPPALFPGEESEKIRALQEEVGALQGAGEEVLTAAQREVTKLRSALEDVAGALGEDGYRGQDLVELVDAKHRRAEDWKRLARQGQDELYTAEQRADAFARTLHTIRQTLTKDESADLTHEVLESCALLYHSRWIPLRRTTPGGQTIFVCRACGRESVFPDEKCPPPERGWGHSPLESCADWEPGPIAHPGPGRPTGRLRMGESPEPSEQG